MSEAVPGWRVGVDIGGTFTDGLLWNEQTGERWAAKVLTTPEDLSIGFVRALRSLLEQAELPAAEVGYLVHATTTATNAVLEGQLAKTAYITTKGFRDVFEIARQVRPDPYDVFTQKPPPLVPRDLCFEVRERMTAEGDILTPVSVDDVAAVAEQISSLGLDAVAVCLLHSYINPAHEQQVAEILSRVLPDVVVTISSDLAPEFREYPRACTAVVNAGLVPVVAEYLSRIEKGLVDQGVPIERLHVMQSNGGVLTFARAAVTPVHILESGPAAGVMGATHVGLLANQPNLISFDMGGTTAKVGLVVNGSPSMAQEFELGEESRSRDWFTGAHGYPILSPSVDLVEIGAGGGSIARVDSGGKLRVGPRSAGASPGPACYGFGGTEATVTDANLVLGRLNPSRELADGIAMDLRAAEQAISKLADPLGMSVIDVALGIIDIANAAMVRAIRSVSVQRGYDAREFTLGAFGGAGPLHAAALAQEMGIKTLIVQPQPGIASALGLLVTDIKHEFSTTWMRATADIDPQELEAVFAALEVRAQTAIDGDSMDVVSVEMHRALDMRYDGQSYQLVVPVGDEPGALDIAAAQDAFHALHEQTYGYAEATEPTGVVNVRLTAVSRIRKPAGLSRWPDTSDARGRQDDRRQVIFGGLGSVDTPILARGALSPGWKAAGPLVIEEADSATLVPPGWMASVSDNFDLVLTAETKVDE
jgi:N-methylhydantoinase A